MTLEEYNFKNVPEYYSSMYMDGYTPNEIWYALKRSVRTDLETPEVNIISEVKVK